MKDEIQGMKEKQKLAIPVKRPSKKKQKDKPKRPLSAYNFFFKEEREKILKVVLAEDPDKVDNDPESEDYLDEERLARLRKEGGKVSFEEMGKLIGQRWKTIDPNRLSRFSELAAEDTERYKKEMTEYNGRQEQKMRSEALKPAAAVSYARPDMGKMGGMVGGMAGGGGGMMGDGRGGGGGGYGDGAMNSAFANAASMGAAGYGPYGGMEFGAAYGMGMGGMYNPYGGYPGMGGGGMGQGGGQGGGGGGNGSPESMGGRGMMDGGGQMQGYGGGGGMYHMMGAQGYQGSMMGYGGPGGQGDQYGQPGPGMEHPGSQQQMYGQYGGQQGWGQQ